MTKKGKQKGKDKGKNKGKWLYAGVQLVELVVTVDVAKQKLIRKGKERKEVARTKESPKDRTKRRKENPRPKSLEQGMSPTC